MKTKAKVDNINQWLKARQMALMGYITKIIMIETGLTVKQVRRLYAEIRSDGCETRSRCKSFRNGSTLIHNLSTKMQASTLMQLYVNIGGNDVIRSIDINALTKAYRMYHGILQEIESASPVPLKLKKFDITDAWCLANELRSNQAMLEECSNCGCTHFTSEHERTLIQCPFCEEQYMRSSDMVQRRTTSPELPETALQD